MKRSEKRYFVALDLPQSIGQAIVALGMGLSGSLYGARWVKEDQLHLTLRFLGECDGGKLKDLQNALSYHGFKAFDLKVKGVGFFPPHGGPKVLWAGVEKNDKLERLRNKIERIVVEEGEAPEQRKFTPHITLAKLKEAGGFDIQNFMQKSAFFELPPFTVKSFHLYSSTSTGNGAYYRIEATYPLE